MKEYKVFDDDIYEDDEEPELEICTGNPLECGNFEPDFSDTDETDSVECKRCGRWVPLDTYKKWLEGKFNVTFNQDREKTELTRLPTKK